MKIIIEKIRKARTWRERVEISENKVPETCFDYVFEAVPAQDLEKFAPHIAREDYERLGKWLSAKIRKRESQLLHDLANAVGALKRHKPAPDYDLIVLFEKSGLYPPGWGTWTPKKSNYKPDCIGLVTHHTHNFTPGKAIAMRDIKAAIKRRDPNWDDDKWEGRRRRIQRYADEFKIALDDKGGRPRKIIAT